MCISFQCPMSTSFWVPTYTLIKQIVDGTFVVEKTASCDNLNICN